MNYDDLLKKIQRLSAAITHTTEQSEAIVAEIDEGFRELARTGVLTAPVILGEPFLRGRHESEEGAEMVVQAAILPDRGCGCVGWHWTEFKKWDRNGNLDEHAPEFFHPFESSDADLRRLLLPQLELLFRRFAASFSPSPRKRKRNG